MAAPVAADTDSVQLDALFDDIPYVKAGGILWAAASLMGIIPFRAAMRRYVRTHPYDTVVVQDLLDALQ